MSDSEAGEHDRPARNWRRVLKRPTLPALRLPALPGLRIGAGEGDHPWSEWLFWLFRIVAVFELLKGLLHWAALLGAGGTPFLDMPTAFRAATIYFAVLDPVAGVGMWLTSSWGAVLWLLAAVSQVVLCFAFPEAFGALWPLVAIEVLAIACYVWFTLRVAASGETM